MADLGYYGGWDYDESAYYGLDDYEDPLFVSQDLGVDPSIGQDFGLADIRDMMQQTDYDFGEVDYGAQDMGTIMPDQQGNIDEAFSRYEAPMSPRDAMTEKLSGERDQYPEGQTPGRSPSIGERAGAAFDKLPAGSVAQAGLGIAGLGAIGAGLATKTGGKLNMGPEEKAAYQALQTARAKASGSMASRGYAGEEGIRKKLNEDIMASLSGNADFVSPETKRRMDADMRTFEAKVNQELGPGGSVSTAGRNALDNRRRMWEEILDQEREQKLATRNSMAFPRSQFYRQSELDPANLAQMELGYLGQMRGQQDAQTSADRRALFQVGGQAGGMALSPYLLRALLSQYRNTAQVA